jgi:hypothetical protein
MARLIYTTSMTIDVVIDVGDWFVAREVTRRADGN